MFCANCGTENDDGVVFCSNCGKSPKGVIVNKQNQGSGYPLTNFTAKSFSILFEIILWIILIGGFIGGGVLGNALSGWGSDYTFFGIILGGITAFITIILTGGLVSMFIKLVNYIEEIKKKIS